MSMFIRREIISRSVIRMWLMLSARECNSSAPLPFTSWSSLPPATMAVSSIRLLIAFSVDRSIKKDIKPATIKAPSVKLVKSMKFRFRISSRDKKGWMSKIKRGLSSRLASIGKKRSSGLGFPYGGGRAISITSILLPAGKSLNEETLTVPFGSIKAASIMGNPTRAPMLRISSSEILLSKLHSFAISSIKKRVVTRGSRLVCWPVKKSNPNTRGKSVTAMVRIINWVRSLNFILLSPQRLRDWICSPFHIGFGYNMDLSDRPQASCAISEYRLQ